MPTVQRTSIKIGIESGLVALGLCLAPAMCVAGPTAAVSGVVRDTQGVAQMGAMVEVLAASSATVAAAFTDMSGRYRIANLVPGSYQVRATAALFVPALRRNLRLATGMRATVNLTLNMLSDPMAWLPAERRRPDEPDDDWTWTLRSAVNRPILRVLDDGQVVMVAGAATGTAREDNNGRHMKAMASVSGGGGGFGAGGVRTVVALDRAMGNGSDAVVRGSFGAMGAVARGAPSAELDAGYQRPLGFAGTSRMVVSCASHPEMTATGGNSGGATGVQVMRVANAESMQLGDTVDLEAGGTVYAVRTAEVAVTGYPFLRVTVHPGDVWAMRYQLATSRDVQSFDGLDSTVTEMPVTTVSGGRVAMEEGNHQEIALRRKMGKGVIEAAVYHDAIKRPAIKGAGAMSTADLMAGAGESGVVADSSTGTFEFLGAGYSTNGVSVTVSEPMTANLWAALEYETGAALASANAEGERLAAVAAGLHAEDGQAVTATVQGKVLRTGTKVRAAYRWQPRHLVTAVNPYDGDQAYLGFYVRQAVRWGNRLPPGLEATVDVTNLLAQGYLPFLSADGRTLFLAQSPRSIQGGLSFTF
jgi:Carboxypeptidase regulatory-like domain